MRTDGEMRVRRQRVHWVLPHRTDVKVSSTPAPALDERTSFLPVDRSNRTDPNILSCTGEATRVTVHTPYSTVTFSSDEPGKSKPGSGPGKTTATSSSALDEPTRSNPGPGPEKTTTTSSSALDKPNTGSSPSSDGDSDGDSSTAEPTGDSDDGGTPTGAGETSSPTDDQSPPNAAGIMAPANLRELLALPLVALVAFLF